jgi:hypothetical protein
MQTTRPPVPTSLPRKSRRRWYVLGFLLLLLLAVPVSYYFLASWWGNREIEEICRELDQDDPHWRWHDLIGQMKPPPDEKNAAVQIVKVHALLKKTPFSPGPKWDNAPKDPLRDPYDGQPLRWRRTATGVIVYCVGPDKIDNGGKFDRDDPTAADTDLGFELWDTPRARGVPAPATEEKPIGGAR